MSRSLVVIGLSLSSSWGNGHAPTFRGLLRGLHDRGWSVTFFERDVEWYRSNRDLSNPDFCDLRLYGEWADVELDVDAAIRAAEATMVGSLVPNGAEIIDSLVPRGRPLFFYDIDTPVTLVELRRAGETEYLRADQIPLFETYFSFAGGPALEELERQWGARHAEALYCGVDTTVYSPAPPDARFECALSYMGTYTADRQPAIEELLFEPARLRPDERFLLAGAQFPPMAVPPNLEHYVHIYPRDHAAFYCSSRATLNLTREAMRRYGWAPSTRMFEAAACGACMISDTWPGLDQLFAPESEILLAESRFDVLAQLDGLSSVRRASIGAAARVRVLRDHTYDRRAAQVEAAIERCLAGTTLAGGRER